MDARYSIAGLGAVGTLLSAAAQVSAGRGAASAGTAQRRAAEFEAVQMEAAAGQERASAQRHAAIERRKGRLAASALQARAAASGGGAADPTVLRLEGDIAAETEYRALAALFGGEERARGLETGAGVRRHEGAEAERAGRIKRRAGMLAAGSTLLTGIGTLFTKYGEREPAIEKV